GVGLGGLAGGGYARFRPVRGVTSGGRLHALTGEVGYSLSKFRSSPDLFSAMGHDSRYEERTAELAHFAQLDMGWETRSTSGFTLRIAIGLAFMLNPGSMKCTQLD